MATHPYDLKGHNKFSQETVFIEIKLISYLINAEGVGGEHHLKAWKSIESKV